MRYEPAIWASPASYQDKLYRSSGDERMVAGSEAGATRLARL